jgi:hypothetical protein
MVLSDLDLGSGPVAVRRLHPRLTRALVIARRRDRYFSAAAREFTTVLEAEAGPSTPFNSQTPRQHGNQPTSKLAS